MDDFKKDENNQYENKQNKEELYFDGKNYYSKEEFFNPDDDHELKPKRKRKWVKITLSVILTLSLFSYVLAIWPKLFNMASIEFISTSIELSKNEKVQQYKESVVVVKAGNSKGTGFYYSDKGYIMTNEHVINDKQNITVTFHDGEVYPAEMVNSDEEIDFAILKIDADELNYPILEFVNNWEQNQPVYIIGNPLYSTFIVNKGNILGQTTNHVIPKLIVDASVYKGNSGSPVINYNGKVVGVIFATTKINYEGSQKKVGLAIPIEYINFNE